MLNYIVVMGRLTRDPELKTTSNGVSVCNFTLAVDRDYKSADGERQTDFIDFVAFRGTADFVKKWFAKGRQAAVVGQLQIDSYTDKDGNKRRAAKVLVDEIHFADSKRENADGGAEAAAPAAPTNFAEITDDDGDLPF